MSFLPVTEVDVGFPLPPIEERLQNFNNCASRCGVSKEDETLFAVTAASDLIMHDRFWRYQSILKPEDLHAEVTSLPTVNLEAHFARTREVWGWNALQRLPKEKALAISKGSVFVYRTNAPPKDIIGPLKELERGGVGERKIEGFGRVVICHPFHYREEEQRRWMKP